MTSIQISQLNLTGYDLLEDAESFLNELATQDVETVVGGGHGKYWGGHSGHGYSGHGYSGHGYSGHGYSGGYKHSCWF